MSDVTSATSAQAASAASSAAAATSSTAQGMGEEFTSFIKLLTAQVQNQDPLSPMDSTQFVEQLATFSTLEQQVASNENLKTIATMIGDLHSMLASDWLGQEVMVQSDWVPYSGETIDYALDTPETANEAVLTVQNADGDVVWSETLDLDDDTYSWNGETDSGIKAGSGELFKFNIDVYENGTHLGTLAPKVITKITDVANEDGTLRFGTSSHLTGDLSTVETLSD